MEKEINGTTPGWVIWFVGLPGSGKSTYAGAVFKDLQNKGEKVQYLSMDEWRKVYSPNPKYTWEERARLYRLFAEEASKIAYNGVNVIMDGTAQQLSMRNYARKLVPRFAEVFVRCSLEIAIRRESSRPDGPVMANLYNKALKRKQMGVDFQGLGEVIGVDVPFEEDSLAECIIDSEYMSVEQGRDHVLAFLDRWKYQQCYTVEGQH
jgi:adenylylsulfate kinase